MKEQSILQGEDPLLIKAKVCSRTPCISSRLLFFNPLFTNYASFYFHKPAEILILEGASIIHEQATLFFARINTADGARTV